MARTMRISNPADWAKATQQGASGAMQQYIDGVRRVQVAPTQAAADNIQGYLNGINNAVSSGKLENALRQTTLQDWQAGAIQKGANRYTQGMQAATTKLQRGGQILLQAIQQAKAATDQMPRATLEERIAKSAAYQRAMSQAIAQLKGNS